MTVCGQDLLATWLASYDPIHRGWTPRGITNGVCATSGWFFPRIRGGYNLRRSTTGVPDASSPVVGAAGADAETIRTFPWVTHAAATSYTHRIMAVSGGGVENTSDEELAVTAFDGDGAWVGSRPNPPADVQVSPMAGGRLSLRWTYTREGEQVEPQSFRLYHDGGSGSVDYDTVIATVPYRRGRFHYRFESAPFADGTRVRWAVRAVSATGAEDLDTVVVSGWADASAPPKNPTVLVTCEGTA